MEKKATIIALMYMIFLGFILIDTSNKTNVVNPTTSPVPPPPMRTDKNKNTRYSLFWKVNLSLYSKQSSKNKKAPGIKYILKAFLPPIKKSALILLIFKSIIGKLIIDVKMTIILIAFKI